MDDDKKIKDILKTISVKKTGDTPLDFYDLVNKGYSDISGRSHKTSTQSITGSLETKIVWEVNDYAKGITWDSVNNRFTSKLSGIYWVSSGVMYTSPGSNGGYGLEIWKNGSEYSRMTVYSIIGQAVTPTISDSLSLNVGDYVEIYANNTTATTTSIGGANNLCYVTIKKIG